MSSKRSEPNCDLLMILKRPQNRRRMSKISSKCDVTSKSIQVDEELLKDFAVNNSNRSRNKRKWYPYVGGYDKDASPYPSDEISENLGPRLNQIHRLSQMS